MVGFWWVVWLGFLGVFLIVCNIISPWEFLPDLSSFTISSIQFLDIPFIPLSNLSFFIAICFFLLPLLFQGFSFISLRWQQNEQTQTHPWLLRNSVLFKDVTSKISILTFPHLSLPSFTLSMGNNRVPKNSIKRISRKSVPHKLQKLMQLAIFSILKRKVNNTP